MRLPNMYLIRQFMNKINSKKLLHSKWTKVIPIDKERHFLISELKYDDNAIVSLCLIEAVISKRQEEIDWKELKDQSKWIQGWK